MDGLLGTLIAATGTVGGFLAPVIRERLIASKLKQKLELIEMIDAKLSVHKKEMTEKLDEFKEKMVTRDFMNSLIELLKLKS